MNKLKENKIMNSEWILTAEKLPPSNVDVLVSVYDGNLGIGKWDGQRQYWVISETIMNRTRLGKRLVLAWMELPPVYRGK